MNARPAKFLFGTEFGASAPAKQNDQHVLEVARLTAEIAQAEQRGRAAGFAAGKADAEAAELARIAGAIDRLAAASETLLSTLERERSGIEREAVALAVTTAQTLARGLVAREPAAEIMRLAEQAFTNLRNAPHLVLRVAPDLLEAVETRVKALAWQRGFDGRLIVLGEPDIAPGDCRIEWADGGLVRDTEATNRTIEDLVANYLRARAAGETEA